MTEKRIAAVLVSALLLAGACGGGGDSDDETTGDALTDALAATADAPAYRIVTESSQQLAPTGDASSVGSDLPAVVVEVDDDGDQAMTIDFAPMLAAGGVPSLEELESPMWVSGDKSRMVGDTMELGQLGDLPGLVPLFEPGRWTVDLDAVAAGDEELLAAIIGTGIVDPPTLARSLLETTDAAIADPEDPGRFVASTSYRTIVDATGQDVEGVARGAAVGVAPFLGADVDELTEVYAEVYATAPAEVELVIVEGALRELSFDADLSAVFGEIADNIGELDASLSAAEQAEIAASLRGGSLVVSSRSTFEIDPSIEVEVPDGDDLEDRTESARELMSDLAG